MAIPAIPDRARGVATEVWSRVAAWAKQGGQWVVVRSGDAQQWLSARNQAAFFVTGVVVVVLLFIFSTVTAALAAVAAWVALLRHFAQTEADRQRRFTETFSKAVEQLGSEKREVRVGGIYTLERLANEALANEAPVSQQQQVIQKTVEERSGPVDLYWTVMETLTAFVREQAPWPPRPKARAAEMTPDSAVRQSSTQCKEKQLRPEPPTDIAAVITVIQRRLGHEREKGRIGWRLDLRAVDLRGASALRGAHLERAYLNGAHLEGADLHDAHLEGAILSDAEGLTQAQIDEAYGDANTKLPEGQELTWPTRWIKPASGSAAPAQ
jgi:hypothetical protein